MPEERQSITVKGVVTGISKRMAGTKAVFFLQLAGEHARMMGRGEIKCACFKSLVDLYMPCEVKGSFDGGLFDVESIRPVFTSIPQVAEYMACRVKGSGVGKKRAGDIVKKYGGKVFAMDFKEFHDALNKDFPGIPVKARDAFLERWLKKETVSELEVFLSRYDVCCQAVASIDSAYGEEALETVKSDPYGVCLRFGLDRGTAEALAYDLGIGCYDRRRIAALASFALKAAGKQGHTYMSAASLASRVSRYSIKSPYRAGTPVIYTANAVVGNPGFILDRVKGNISFRGIYNDEINAARKLRAINGGIHNSLNVTEGDIDAVERKLGITLASAQRKAFSLLNGGGVGILTGGPGTGKTTIVKGMILCFKKSFPGGRIRLLAPTGRAARKLSEATGAIAETIHKAIGLLPYDGAMPEFGAANPLEADLVIMDETSMCDTHVLSLLLNALSKGCRVIFIGDENQLPSVGAGDCLHDMIKSGVFTVCRLTENFRSEGSITENAKLVLKGEMPEEAEDFEIIKAPDEEGAFSILTGLMDRYYDKDDPFRCQMIEPSNKGEIGTKAMNLYIHKHVVHKDLGERASEDMMVGDKIMFIHNEYAPLNRETVEMLYVNGEMGVIKSLLKDSVTIWDGYEEKVLPRSALDDAVYSYSCTIHKAQGSESDIVLICLPESVKGMMNRSLLYTAITRARKKVVIVYTGDALKSCVLDEGHVKRNTRLLERLKEV